MNHLKIVGTNSLLQAAKRLLEQGEITLEQYEEMCRRNASLDEYKKEDVIIQR